MRRAKTSHAAFTLVELLIGVTVSAIIMAGVSVFMGSGIESAFKIRKGIEDNRASGDFDAALGKFVAFGGELLYSGSFSAPFGSGIVLKNANRPIPLGILAVETITGVCDAYSGTSDDPGIATKLSIIETYAPNGIENAAGLTVDHTGHVVRNASDAVVLGTGNGGNSGGNGTAGTSTELFYPSAVLDMGGGKYLVADSGNDRVLLLN
ncbi:MAG: hypothetical protein QG650_678 [Patescibacteria group bacterium]|nr:hypothetical protein [Patescibacteria group bacterium]